MKFVPTNTNFIVDPITTPNKNIQSYFLRSEAMGSPVPFISSSQPLQILVFDDLLVVGEKKIHHNFVRDNRMNVKTHGSVQKCIDGIYTLLHSVVSRDMLESPVQLIISDFMGRSDTVCLIDIILNQLGFSAVTVLPLSLCLSFHLNQNYGCFVYHNGFSFIDDFCLIDSCDMCDSDYIKVRPDDEDFAEEYSRLALGDDQRFSCDECSQKEDNEEKIRAHVIKEHKDATFFEYQWKDDLKENLANRMRFQFNKDKFEKVSKKIYTVGTEPLENPFDLAISGAQLFANLEISKELWMTGDEWRALRLRILKEKVLFYI